jgi:hypothetical protein
MKARRPILDSPPLLACPPGDCASPRCTWSGQWRRVVSMMKKLISILVIFAMAVAQAGPAFAQTEPQPPPASQTPPPPATQPPPESTPQPVPSNTQPTQPQSTPAPDVSKTDLSECVERGREDGRHVDTGGSFLGGLVGGVLLGLIGTGIAYVAQGEPDPPATAKYEIKDAQCRLAYDDAYGEQGKKKKRSAALGGGLIGTAVFIVIIVASSSSSQ